MAPSIEIAKICGSPRQEGIFYDEEIACRGIDNPLWHDDWNGYDADSLISMCNSKSSVSLDEKRSLYDYQGWRRNRRVKPPNNYSGLICLSFLVAAYVFAVCLTHNSNERTTSLPLLDVICRDFSNQSLPEFFEIVRQSPSLCNNEVSICDI